MQADPLPSSSHQVYSSVRGGCGGAGRNSRAKRTSEVELMGREIMKCAFCGQLFENVRELDRHLKKRHDYRPLLDGPYISNQGSTKSKQWPGRFI